MKVFSFVFRNFQDVRTKSNKILSFHFYDNTHNLTCNAVMVKKLLVPIKRKHILLDSLAGLLLNEPTTMLKSVVSQYFIKYSPHSPFSDKFFFSD